LLFPLEGKRVISRIPPFYQRFQPVRPRKPGANGVLPGIRYRACTFAGKPCTSRPGEDSLVDTIRHEVLLCSMKLP
jgi:hypothetical protein